MFDAEVEKIFNSVLKDSIYLDYLNRKSYLMKCNSCRYVWRRDLSERVCPKCARNSAFVVDQEYEKQVEEMYDKYDKWRWEE
jgi:hypothetical protein